MKKFFNGSIFFFLIVLFSGCFFNIADDKIVFIRDKGHFMDEDVVHNLSSILDLFSEKTGVHFFLITQTQDTANPVGSHDFIKDYQRKNPDLKGIICVIWHHDHSRLDIVATQFLQISSSIQIFSKEFYKKANRMGFDVAFQSLLMTICSRVAEQFEINFNKLIKEKYPHYDYLDIPLRKLKKQKNV